MAGVFTPRITDQSQPLLPVSRCKRGVPCVCAAAPAGELSSHALQLPGGLQSPPGGAKPPLASPGHAPPPQRSASERSLSGASTPGRGGGPAGAPLGGSGGSGNVAGIAAAAAAAAAGKAAPSAGVSIKGDRGRFKVYEVRAPVGWSGQMMSTVC